MKRAAAEPVSVLRWTFQQNRRVLTCAVRAENDGASFDVTLVPHWDVSATSIETFDKESGAFARHAEIAMQLRDAGWVVSRRQAA